MRKRYTTIYFFLIYGWTLFWGFALPFASAQGSCVVTLTNINVLPTEQTIDGVVYKRVQVVVNNTNPGLSEKFYFLFDGADRDSSTKYYEYGYNTEVFLVPVDVQEIVFRDFNTPSCELKYTPNFSANKCPINVSTYIDLSAGDCFNRTVTFTVQTGFRVDSVVWKRNGGRESVHDQMRWINIPPGDYEIFFYNDDGCEAMSKLSTCITRTDAGDDEFLPYCIGEDDTVNLYDLLSSDVDPGSFFTEDYKSLDSISASHLVYDTEANNIYYYIAPASLEIPDTSQFTIQARDCSVCAYELVSAQRYCSDPETIEVVIGGGTTEDTTFRLTLPDGSTVTRNFFTPFQVDFPNFQDPLNLAVQMDTPTGTCDSIITVGPVASPMIQVTTSEIVMAEDSVGIEVSVSQGAEPYQVDVFVGSQQEYKELAEGETHQFSFLQSVDTAYVIAVDEVGCMGTDTLVLTPDCIRPEVELVQGGCGKDKGQVKVDLSMLPTGSQITWTDNSTTDLWERSALDPGTYYYEVTYDQCRLEGEVTIEDNVYDFPEVTYNNDCQIDNRVEIYIPDSAQVRQWSFGETVLPHFSGFFPANQDLLFHIETNDGCIDTVMMRMDETPWIERIGFQEPNGVSVELGVDAGILDNYGWGFTDSVLCNNCLDFRSNGMLEAGAYVFYAEQFPGCRMDTAITIDEPEHAFVMPNVITPGSGRNSLLQIFDPLNQMVEVKEFQVYDRFGNVLFQKFDFMPDDDASINWPNGSITELPNVIICVARIRCKEGDEVTVAQDVLILR